MPSTAQEPQQGRVVEVKEWRAVETLMRNPPYRLNKRLQRLRAKLSWERMLYLYRQAGAQCKAREQLHHPMFLILSRTRWMRMGFLTLKPLGLMGRMVEQGCWSWEEEEQQAAMKRMAMTRIGVWRMTLRCVPYLKHIRRHNMTPLLDVPCYRLHRACTRLCALEDRHSQITQQIDGGMC
jgi:hypothetical protein